MGDAFLDTSVLLDYALDDSPAALQLFQNRTDVRKVTSERGKNEFLGVFGRRKRIHELFREYLIDETKDKPDLNGEEWLSPNDEAYVSELFERLRAVETPEEALRRLNERKRRLQTRYRSLFERSDNYVETVSAPDINTSLLSSFLLDIENEFDAKLLCDAVEWSREGGSGVFLTTDTGDFFEEPDSADESDSNGLPDTLADLGAGENRSLAERIEDHVRREYSQEATVEIMTTANFLSSY